ncbi:hypothetical protein EV363DRAFT_1340174 [Boletus edulis]|nr:hypothetical protein EV363DRAFT_1340174 [Boletus edulis]
MRNFDACALCLQRARDPIACDRGHLFCKECAYADLRMQSCIPPNSSRETAEEEKQRALEAARDRVLRDFEKGQQLGLSANLPAVASTSGAESKEGRTGKRKLDFDSSTVETLAREAEDAALRLIEREQAEALRHKLPDFWLPSLTPTYTSNGPPSSLKDVKVQTMCRGGDPPHAINLKSFIPVQFSFPASSSAQSTDSTPTTNDVKKTDEPKNPICPSCKSNLSNNKILFLMRPCSHVTCKVCTDSLVRPASQCIVCDRGLANLDIVELKREGTGFAGGGLAETTKKGVAFQG